MLKWLVRGNPFKVSGTIVKVSGPLAVRPTGQQPSISPRSARVRILRANRNAGADGASGASAGNRERRRLWIPKARIGEIEPGFKAIA